MVGHIETFGDVLPSVTSAFVYSLIVLSVSLAFTGLVFHLLLDRPMGTVSRISNSFHLFFAAQILKYIPGKIWGIAYQITRSSKQIPIGTMARVNVDHTILTLAVNFVIAILFLGYSGVYAISLAISAALVTIFATSIFMLGGADAILNRVKGFLPASLEKLSNRSDIKPLNWKLVLVVVFVQIFAMGFYAFSWLVLANAYPQLINVNLLEIGMIYVVASSIGIVTMITPAGLGVREASFVALAIGLASPQELGFIAIVARIWFSFAEMTAGVIIVGLTTFLSLQIGSRKLDKGIE